MFLEMRTLIQWQCPSPLPMVWRTLWQRGD